MFFLSTPYFLFFTQKIKLFLLVVVFNTYQSHQFHININYCTGMKKETNKRGDLKIKSSIIATVIFYFY